MEALGHDTRAMRMAPPPPAHVPPAPPPPLPPPPPVVVIHDHGDWQQRSYGGDGLGYEALGRSRDHIYEGGTAQRLSPPARSGGYALQQRGGQAHGAAGLPPRALEALGRMEMGSVVRPPEVEAELRRLRRIREEYQVRTTVSRPAPPTLLARTTDCTAARRPPAATGGLRRCVAPRRDPPLWAWRQTACVAVAGGHREPRGDAHLAAEPHASQGRRQHRRPRLQLWRLASPGLRPRAALGSLPQVSR